MTISEYIAYFRTTAVNNKRIAHDPGVHDTFFEIDIEQVWQNMKLETTDMSMVIECPEIRPSDVKSDNIRKMTTGAFLIIQEVEVSNIVDRETKLNETFMIAEQIASKLINDYKIYQQDKQHPFPIKGFDPATLYWQKVGPALGQHFGWRVEFTISDTFTNGLQLDATKWNNETSYKDLF